MNFEDDPADISEERAVTPNTNQKKQHLRLSVLLGF